VGIFARRCRDGLARRPAAEPTGRDGAVASTAGYQCPKGHAPCAPVHREGQRIAGGRWSSVASIRRICWPCCLPATLGGALRWADTAATAPPPDIVGLRRGPPGRWPDVRRPVLRRSPAAGRFGGGRCLLAGGAGGDEHAPVSNGVSSPAFAAAASGASEVGSSPLTILAKRRGPSRSPQGGVSLPGSPHSGVAPHEARSVSGRR
jgi:hypothetical protein